MDAEHLEDGLGDSREHRVGRELLQPEDVEVPAAQFVRQQVLQLRRVRVRQRHARARELRACAKARTVAVPLQVQRILLDTGPG